MCVYIYICIYIKNFKHENCIIVNSLAGVMALDLFALVDG